MARPRSKYPKNGNLRINLSEKTHKKLSAMADKQKRYLKIFIELKLDEFATGESS